MTNPTGLGCRRVLASALIATFAGVLAVGCDNAEQAHQVEETAEPHSPPWLPGQAASYSFRLTSSTSLGALPSSGEVELLGKVVIRAGELKGGVQILELQPSAVRLARPKGVADDVIERLLADLERPFGLELKDGVLAAYLEPEESMLLAFGLRRQLGVLTQRAEADQPGAAQWSAEEWDASGRAKVTYAQNPDKPDKFSWEKSGYSQVLANKAPHAALQDQNWKPEVVKSNGFIQVDDQGVLTIERSESLQTEMTKGQYIRSTYSAKLKRIEVGAPAPAPDKDDVVRRLVDAPLPKMDTSSLDALRFAGKTWDEVIASLPQDQAAKQAKANFAARQAAFHALVGLFRVEEENVAKAISLIEAHDPRSSTLLRALAAASTDTSMAVLSDMALDKKRPEVERKTIAATYLRAEMPQPSAIGTLERFAADPLLKSAGVLGLGTFGRLWREAGQTELSERAAKKLGEELFRAKKPVDLKNCLLGVANSGDSRFFEQAVAHQSSTAPGVSDAAIQAIRLMKDDRVEPTLVALLASAKKPAERITILSSLAQQKKVSEPTVKIVESHTEPSSDAAVRRQAAMTLGAWVRKHPRLKDVLRVLGESDEDARVREAAQMKSM